MKLTAQQINQYLHRSYTAVDGLWFMKVEQQFDFETALEIDEQVWQIVPKIQARQLKELTGCKNGLEGLYECFTTKLELDCTEFESEKEPDGKGFTIIIKHCHWLELLRKSQREHLAEKIGSRICNAEYATWAGEFGSNIRFELQSQLCKNAGCCRLRFTTS